MQGRALRLDELPNRTCLGNIVATNPQVPRHSTTSTVVALARPLPTHLSSVVLMLQLWEILWSVDW